MRIREIVESWIDEHFTFVDNTAKEQLITLFAAESKYLHAALRQYAIRENWACGRTQDQNVWERDYEHGWKLAEETLGEGRQWPENHSK